MTISAVPLIKDLDESRRAASLGWPLATWPRNQGLTPNRCLGAFDGPLPSLYTEQLQCGAAPPAACLPRGILPDVKVAKGTT